MRHLLPMYVELVVLVMPGMIPAAGAIGDGAQRPPPLDLKALIETALAESPELAAADFHIAAAAARIPQAGALPDPMVGINLNNVPVNTFAFDKVAMSGIQLNWRQTYPALSKRRLRQAMERYGVDIAVFDRAEAENRLVADMKKAYFELGYIRRARLITEENRKLLEDFADVARTKYEVGKGIQADVLRVEVELSKITDQLLALRREDEVWRSRLNRLLNRPPDTPMGEPGEIAQYGLPLTLDAAESAARESRPMLQAMDSMLDKLGLGVELARKDLRPDLSFDLGYRIRSNSIAEPSHGRDWYSIGVSASLPIFSKDKQRMSIEEKQADRDALTAEIEGMYYSVDQTIAALFADIRKQEQQASLLETAIVPQAELALASSRAAYQVNAVEFLTMLTNQMQLYQYQTAYYRALVDQAQAIADLEYQMGVRLYE
jgi:cobalt-zinc-cadmium efflux system outer membrane protein